MNCLRVVTVTFVMAFCNIGGVFALGGESDFTDLKILRVIPRTPEEIAQAHDRARGNACEPVPPEQPLEIKDFMPILTDRDAAEFDRGRLLMPSSRRHMFTVGLDIHSSDKSRLPKVSGNQILGYVQGHYVTIQARVQKDPGTNELFLHHRPLAATAAFGKGGLTQEFVDAVLVAVREFHSLGVYLPTGKTQRPKNLRTIVMIYRSMTVLPTDISGKTTLKPLYEYVFVRARDVPNARPPQLDLFVFATSNQRKRLHLLNPWAVPERSGRCGVHATVLFTEYSTLGLIPTKSATRNVSYSSKQIIPWEELDRYATSQRLRGDALDNLDVVLDAFIDQKIPVMGTLTKDTKSSKAD